MSGIPAGAGSLLGKRLGKYEILALLALGGTAEIYLARIGGAAGFEKYVVVKCLHDHLADDTEFVKMFLDEARLAAHLDHSNIVQTMELGEHENRYYMVMEFLAGLSLAMMVRRASERLHGGRIPAPLVLNMIAQSCAGLHYAHERVMNGKPLNIVHRDISPQNLVVSFEGVVKVVDFGIAKAELRETRTRSGTIKGKFAYMSPEQCVANNVDRRTDVFALGVIAHELLTGRRLFKKPSPYETYQSVIECAVPPPSRLNVELDPALDPIIMRAVEKDKERRYPTAEAFGDALLGYLHHRGKGSGPGEVSRFFDASFGQEIEEHGARMRELISGREFVADSVNWGGEDEKQHESVELSDDKPITVDTADLQVLRPSAGSLSDVIGDLDDGSRSDDDDLPAERTRIEANPLERLNELEAEAARRAPARPTPPTAPMMQRPAMPPSGALPLPPAPSPGIAALKGPGAPQSGRFPELANMPTQIADPDDDASLGPTVLEPAARAAAMLPPLEPAHGAPELAPTRIGGGPVDAKAPTAISMQAQSGNGAMPRPGSSSGAPPMPSGMSGSSPIARPMHPGSGPIARPGPGQSQDPMGPMGPMGPMAGPPGSTPGGSGPGMPGPMYGSMPGGSGPGMPGPMGFDPHAGPGPMGPGAPMPRPNAPPVGPGGYPVMNKQLSDHIASGATVFPSDLGSGPYDSSQQAANVVSPVGAQYPGDVDWAAAAAAPTRALPPWVLALLFVLALGGALVITIAIAKLAR